MKIRKYQLEMLERLLAAEWDNPGRLRALLAAMPQRNVGKSHRDKFLNSIGIQTKPLTGGLRGESLTSTPPKRPPLDLAEFFRANGYEVEGDDQ